MITHLFYHQETVEDLCARNSWASIRNAFAPEDEVILLDLGNTLSRDFPLDIDVKQLRLERIRTDTPEERSYTYGLNLLMPTARHDWIVLWRSDYIYHRDYYPALRTAMQAGNYILPYEAFIGAQWATGDWCAQNLHTLTTAGDSYLLQHAHVCAVYESMDFPHFALRKQLWLDAGGMNPSLWGYGWQFPELYRRLRQLPDARPVYDFRLRAFHQNHGGSFSLGLYDQQKIQEMKDSERKLETLLGSKAAARAFKEERNAPLRPRHSPDAYKPKTSPDPAPLVALASVAQ
jgi:hypothetical protein